MAGIVKLRNSAYDYELLDSVKLSKPVISVGNLSMGGVGKTPFVVKLIELCKERGLRPAVISRNYKALSRGVHKISLTHRHPQFDPARFYGDEPFMLAQKFPDVPVFTGALKYFTASVAGKMRDIDVLIIDDGFQHRSLQKDFEIVLIDASKSDQENQIFPLGEWRESWDSLRRADLVVLSKTEMASAEQIEKLKRKIPEAIPSIEIRSRSTLPDISKEFLAVAGIAHPQHFFYNLKKAGLAIKSTLSFSDHHQFNQADIDKIFHEMRAVGATHVLCTEKDAVKLRAFAEFSPDKQNMDIAHLEIEFLSEPRGLNAFLDQCCSQ